MRPAKKSLEKLVELSGNGDLTELEHTEHSKKFLMQIGDRILEVVRKSKNSEDATSKKSHLWNFVSQFSRLDAVTLHSVYRRASKKRLKEPRSHHAKPAAELGSPSETKVPAKRARNGLFDKPLKQPRSYTFGSSIKDRSTTDEATDRFGPHSSYSSAPNVRDQNDRAGKSDVTGEDSRHHAHFRKRHNMDAGGVHAKRKFEDNAYNRRVAGHNQIRGLDRESHSRPGETNRNEHHPKPRHSETGLHGHGHETTSYSDEKQYHRRSDRDRRFHDRAHEREGHQEFTNYTRHDRSERCDLREPYGYQRNADRRYHDVNRTSDIGVPPVPNDGSPSLASKDPRHRDSYFNQADRSSGVAITISDAMTVSRSGTGCQQQLADSYDPYSSGIPAQAPGSVVAPTYSCGYDPRLDYSGAVSSQYNYPSGAIPIEVSSGDSGQYSSGIPMSVNNNPISIPVDSNIQR